MFGRKVNGTRVFRVTTKIVLTFTIFILLSNLTSNYLNMVAGRSHMLKLMNELLIKDLKTIYSFCNNQYEIYRFDGNLEGSIKSIEQKGLHEIKNEKGILLGVGKDGMVKFQASKFPKIDKFMDNLALATMSEKKTGSEDGGKIDFLFNNEKYFGIYKYNPKWQIFIIRAEEKNEFYSASRTVLIKISILILLITIVSAFIGVFILNRILRFLDIITDSIMGMVKSQEMQKIDLTGATNDDVTYLGVAFNSLSNTIGNLVSIFQKFANQDVVQKAYRDREIKLEGTKKDLTVLFSDIKSFTFITETLGNDIIKLLNLHYDRAIREIVNYDGVIGSIIGDALLAVYGALDNSDENKSYQAVICGYKLHEITELLRIRMKEVKEEVEKEKGKLSRKEMKVFKAVLLEIGVGIDGGNVFYGTLGSYVRMTNTVIGDNVNAASRLEGLTRIYKVPVICSEYIKSDIEENVADHGITFVELDRVMVKGKTQAQRIFWPILDSDLDRGLEKNLTSFELGLELYYQGKWKEARKKFEKCKLDVAEVFKERTESKCPRDWNGLWQMTIK